MKDNYYRRRLINLIVRLTNLHLTPWNMRVQDIHNFHYFFRNSAWDFLDLFDAIYSGHAKKNNLNAYFVKENNVFDFAEQIWRKFYPHVFFVYLVRDPRDVYLSFTKVPGGTNNALMFANQWHSEQEKALGFLDRIEGRFKFEVRYEDILENPDCLIEDCIKKTGLENRKTPLIIRENTNSPYFSNVLKTIDGKNRSKFPKELSYEDMRIIESFNGNIMKRFYYAFMTEGKNCIEDRENKFLQCYDWIERAYRYLTMLPTEEIKIRLSRIKIYFQIRKIMRKSAMRCVYR